MVDKHLHVIRSKASRSVNTASLKSSAAGKNSHAVGLERCESQNPLPKALSPALRLRFNVETVVTYNSGSVFQFTGLIEHWEDYAVSRTLTEVSFPPYLEDRL